MAAMLVCATPGAWARRPAGTPVPQGFVGVNVDGPMLTPSDGVDMASQFDLMVKNGVQTVRVAFSWAAAQPYQSWSQVPLAEANQFVNVGGVPTNFTVTDQIVGLAAERGLTVLPTVLYAPQWDAGRNPSGGFRPPATPEPYAAYLTALVQRYGSNGTYWGTHSAKLPIRRWQIWNEPNISAYWPQPFAQSYVSLLRAAHTAIKRADHRAQVVIGSITNRAWIYLGQVDRVRGARQLFDVVSVNGFTSSPSSELLFLQLIRRAMNKMGYRYKPLLASEFSWPSARGEATHQF